MESRIIFESDKTYLDKVHWKKTENNSESEWKYLNPESITESYIQEIFEADFNGEKVCLIINRKESKEVDKENIFSEIKSLYGKTVFRVWDKNFENVVEFKMEVYRKGKASR